MKKLLSAFLAGSLLIFCGITGFATNDLQTIAVKKAANLGLVTEEYTENSAVTSDEFFNIILNYIKRDDCGIDENFRNYLSREQGSASDILEKMQIISKEDTNYPHIRRERAAQILFGVINTVHPYWKASEKYPGFDDDGEISDEAFNAVVGMYETGIMKGTPNNLFIPKENLTKKETATVFLRIYYTFEEKGIFKNFENLTYSQAESIQESVNNGHQPWRTDSRGVALAFLKQRGEKVNTENLCLAEENAELLQYEYKGKNALMSVELFKPVDKSERGIWAVKAFEKKYLKDTIDNS